MLSKDLSLWWNLAQGTTRLPMLKRVLDGTVFLSCGERHDKQDGRERCMGIEEDLGSVPGVCVWEEPGRIGSRRSWERHGVMIYFCSGKTGLVGADAQHAKRLIPQNACNQWRICPELDTHTSLTQEDLAALRFTRGRIHSPFEVRDNLLAWVTAALLRTLTVSYSVLIDWVYQHRGPNDHDWLSYSHTECFSLAALWEKFLVHYSNPKHSWDIIHSNALTSQ